MDDVHNAPKRARLNIQETTVPDAKQIVAEKLRVIQMRHFASNEYAAGLNSLQDAVRNLVQHTFQSKHVSVARRDRAVQLQRLVHNLQDTALQLAVNVQKADAQKQPLQTGALFQLPTGPMSEDEIKEMQDLKNEVAALKKKLEQESTENVNLQRQIVQLQDRINSFKHVASEEHTNNTRLQAEVDRLTKDVESLTGQLRDNYDVKSAEELESLRNQAEEIEEMADAYKEELDKLKTTIVEMEVEHKEKETQLQRIQSFLDGFEKAQQLLREEQEVLRASIEAEKINLQAANEVSKAAQENASQQLDKLTKECDEKQVQLDELHEQVTQMQADRDKLQDELNDLQTGIGAAANAIATPANSAPSDALVEALKTYVNPNDPRRQGPDGFGKLWQIAFDIRDRIMKRARDAQNCGDVLFITNTERQELLELYSGCQHKQHLDDALKEVLIPKCVLIQTLCIGHVGERAHIRFTTLRVKTITPQEDPQAVPQALRQAGPQRPYTLYELYTFLTNDEQNAMFLEESEQWQEALQNAVDTIRANLMAVLGPVAKGLLTSSDDMVASEEDSMIPAVLSEEDHVTFLRAQWLQYINTRSSSARNDDLREFIYLLATALVKNLLLGARWVKSHNAVFDGTTALLRETFERGKYMRGRTNVTLNAMIYGLFMSPTENAGCRRARVALGEVLQQRQLQSRLLTGVKINTLGSLEYRKQADRAMIAGGIFFNKFICSINYDDMPSCTLSA